MHHAAPLEGRLSDAAAKAVNELLSSGAAGNLSSLCSWADKVRFKGLQGRGGRQGPLHRWCHQQLHLPAPHQGIIIAITIF
ncbi:hypothetical protein CFC21_083955 [Triticum aestivum]|uniref:Uncharacterized protein n=3 Tax=Triticum TaxID=4564 RepID=A0A9R0Y374_TRITD|nr:hypothetical protein CFC21_083955 [Triticum aestivum]VAI47942.1 unnamed protein product [Triticum turgidum subsp. durum]